MNLIAHPSDRTCSTACPADVRLPATDIHETPDLVRIRLDVPGAGPEDLEVTFENQTLNLSSKSRETSAGEKVRPPVYQRSIRIPRDLDAASMKAVLKNGVLEIELAKAARPAAVTIPIVS